jgi:hypothetical protein
MASRGEKPIYERLYGIHKDKKKAKFQKIGGAKKGKVQQEDEKEEVNESIFPFIFVFSFLFFSFIVSYFKQKINRFSKYKIEKRR